MKFHINTTPETCRALTVNTKYSLYFYYCYVIRRLKMQQVSVPQMAVISWSMLGKFRRNRVVRQRL